MYSNTSTLTTRQSSIQFIFRTSSTLAEMHSEKQEGKRITLRKFSTTNTTFRRIGFFSKKHSKRTLGAFSRRTHTAMQMRHMVESSIKLDLWPKSLSDGEKL